MWLKPVDYSDEQSAYFAALGRAMALAQNFEQNCKFVFGTLDIGRDYEGGKIPHDQCELMRRSCTGARSERC